MSRIFIQIELLGEVDFAVYQKLDELMQRNSWSRSLECETPTGHKKQVKLPTATYSGTCNADPYNVAEVLAASVKSQIWKQAAVLVMITGESWRIAGDSIS